MGEWREILCTSVAKDLLRMFCEGNGLGDSIVCRPSCMRRSRCRKMKAKLIRSGPQYRASNWDLEAPASEEPKIPSLFKSQRRVEPYDVVVRVLMI